MPRPRLVKWFFVAKSDAMTDAPAFGPAPARIRIIAHAESIEVRFPDGRCRYFYFDDESPRRRTLMGRTTRAEAEEKAKRSRGTCRVSLTGSNCGLASRLLRKSAAMAEAPAICDVHHTQQRPLRFRRQSGVGEPLRDWRNPGGRFWPFYRVANPKANQHTVRSSGDRSERCTGRTVVECEVVRVIVPSTRVGTVAPTSSMLCMNARDPERQHHQVRRASNRRLLLHVQVVWVKVT